MDNVNISIKPTYHEIASCNGCFARNFRSQGGGVGEYVQDLYDVRALPEVFAIVKGGDFAPQVVKGKMEIVDDDTNRIIVKIDALTENVYTFKTEDLQDFVFDTQAEAEARLVELTNRPVK